MRFGAEQQQPVDAFLQQRLQIAVHALFVAIGITQHQAISALEAATLHAAHQLREKGVRTCRDQHPDGTGLVELQAARQCRRRVIQRSDGLLHPQTDSLTHKAIFINDVRDGGGGDTRKAGDIFHCRHDGLPLRL